MSTLTTMRANVRTDLVIDPNADVWSDGTIDRYINEFVGIAYSWDKEAFAETTGSFTIVDGTATYDLASELTNYGELQSLRLDGKTILLDKVDDLNAFESGRDLTFEGEPRYYYFYGDDTIGLWPVPDGVITTMHARFTRSNPTLTASDSPAWAEKWHYVCERYSRWKCLSVVPGHESTARDARAEYNEAKAMMQQDLWQRGANGNRWVNTNPGLWPQGSQRLKI
jgi:hypothetical protein